jgi:hypothetical protein
MTEKPIMTVCACSDPWCRVNGCRIANAQRYGQQTNYGPAYVVPNLHAECAARNDELVRWLTEERDGRLDDREAVIAFLRSRGCDAEADVIAKVGFPLCATLPLVTERRTLDP